MISYSNKQSVVLTEPSTKKREQGRRRLPFVLPEVVVEETYHFSFHSSYFEMGDLDDYDFSTGDAGASHIFNQEAGQIRVGG